MQHKLQAAAAPKETMQQERELRDLTRAPYRSWCPVCVKPEGHANYRKQRYDRRPVIQVDYSCMIGKA
eukprot:10067669-Lingulodinium_polyedra.AAC.1